MKSLSDRHAGFFMVIAETITPEVASLDVEGRARMAAIVDMALMDRGASVRKQFGTFLSVIWMAPAIRFGRIFGSLDPARRAAVLGWFENCPISLLRSGFWGLKVLVFMGYYGRTECWEEIGYAPEFDGRASVRHA